MKHYIGLDVSKKETAICVLDEEQNVVRETTVNTDPEEIANAIQSMQLSNICRIGLESGSWSHWLTKELRHRKLPVTCYDARSVSKVLELNINKTDQNDARCIALGIRSGFFKECQVKTFDQLALGGLVRMRKQLVEQRVQLQNSIRGIFKPFGINLTLALGKAFISNVEANLSALPEVMSTALKICIQCLNEVMKAINELDKQLINETKKQPAVQKLMTLDGVGPITALTFFAEVGDPMRFKDPKMIGAYLGLTPTQYSSGEKEHYGRISKRGCPMLRGLLIQSALVLLTRTQKWSKLRAWGMKIQRERGTPKALVAIARKMAVIMLQMLIDDTVFIRGEKKKQAA